MACAAENSLVEKELNNVKAKYKQIEGAELISCVPVLVQIKITKTDHKSLVACFQFPDNYPQAVILLELKSKVLSNKLLHGLTRLCEEEAKKLQGQQQILQIAKFIRKFIEDTPLCVCSDEIANLKKALTANDEIKLKQKTSQVILKLHEGQYKITAKLTVPDTYPTQSLSVEISESNFPEIIHAHFLNQCIEIARQCVERPLKVKPKDPPFVPKPSLWPVTEYLVTKVIHKYPKEVCPVCREPALPPNPKDCIIDPSHDHFVERVYCSHLYHHSCLDTYMKTPPFVGGKKCPSCGQRIFHEKWKATPQLAEARWAHQEARRRELDEVVDFLQ